eukprot:EG_transcript_20702
MAVDSFGHREAAASDRVHHALQGGDTAFENHGDPVKHPGHVQPVGPQQPHYRLIRFQLTGQHNRTPLHRPLHVHPQAIQIGGDLLHPFHVIRDKRWVSSHRLLAHHYFNWTSASGRHGPPLIK